MDYSKIICGVLNRMVVSNYSDFDFVYAKKYGDVGEGRFYEIFFVIKEGGYNNVNMGMMFEIRDISDSLIKMINLEKGSDYTIIFRTRKEIKGMKL
jgi:hypothetical protein